MKRDYDGGEHDDVVYFQGYEIEKTRAFGMPTLFVVGTPNLPRILEYISIERVEPRTWCTHVYLGANHSFNPLNKAEWALWDDAVRVLTAKGLFVTIDHDVSLSTKVVEQGWTDNGLFIPMVSIKIPYVEQYGYNAIFKIDDKDFNSTNPGVWCHTLHDLTRHDKFTGWDEYKKDLPL